MVGPYGHPGQVAAQNVFNTEGEPVPILNHPREVHTAMELIYKVKIVLMDSVKVKSFLNRKIIDFHPRRTETVPKM